MFSRRDVLHYFNRAKQASSNAAEELDLDPPAATSNTAQTVGGDNDGGIIAGTNNGVITYNTTHHHGHNNKDARAPFDADEAFATSLLFSEMEDRERRIQLEPCGWIPSHAQYLGWLEKSVGLLRLHAPPGSGKSTALRFALETHRKSYTKDVILSFFFSARGQEAEATKLGLLKTLLTQIMRNTAPVAAIQKLKSEFKSRSPQKLRSLDDWIWTEDELQSCLVDSVTEISQMQQVTIFVDALDESSSKPISQYVTLFEDLLQKAEAVSGQVRIVFSCRLWPPVNVRPEALTIEVSKANGADIENYIAAHFKRNRFRTEAATDADISTISTLITSRAGGNFLWADCAVSEAISLWESASSTEVVETRITHLPTRLDSLYEDIFSALSPEDLKDSLKLLQWISFATRPLTVEEMRLALILEPSGSRGAMHSEILQRVDASSFAKANAQTRVMVLSRGLAEITADGLIQFTNHSVGEFVRKEDLMRKIFKDQLDSDKSFAQAAHSRISASCLEYLHIAMQEKIPAVRRLLKISYKTVQDEYPSLTRANPNPLKLIWPSQTFPLWNYALGNWKAHLQMAEKERLPHDGVLASLDAQFIFMAYLINQQSMFLCNCTVCKYNPFSYKFSKAIRKSIDMTLESTQSSRDVRVQGLFWHLCAEAGLLTAFKKLMQDFKSSIDLPDFDYDRTPFFTAVAQGHVGLVEQFLQLKDPTISINRRSYFRGEYCTPLEVAIARDDLEMVKKIDVPEHGATTSHSKVRGRYFQPALKALGEFMNEPVAYQTNRLRWALHCHSVKCIYHYLRKKPKALEYEGDMMIAWQTVTGRKESRQNGLLDAELLDTRILQESSNFSIDWKEKLFDAIQTVSHEVVDMMLRTGRVRPDARRDSSRSTLLLASIEGRNPNLDLVKILMDFPGIDVNGSDRYDYTPLLEAAWRGHVNVLELLVEHPNIDFEARNNQGRNLLQVTIGDKSTADKAKPAMTYVLGMNKYDINGATEYKKKETALHLAVKWIDKAAVRILLEQPTIDVQIKDARGLTPLQSSIFQMKKFEDLASGRKQIELKKLNTDPDFEVPKDADSDQWRTPLQIAKEHLARLNDPAASQSLCRTWHSGYEEIRDMLIRHAVEKGLPFLEQLDETAREVWEKKIADGKEGASEKKQGVEGDVAEGVAGGDAALLGPSDDKGQGSSDSTAHHQETVPETKIEASAQDTGHASHTEGDTPQKNTREPSTSAETQPTTAEETQTQHSTQQ